MFIRWHSRKRNRPYIGPSAGPVRVAGRIVRDKHGIPLLTRRRADGTVAQDVRWGAVLVESPWIDRRTRQRHIAFLGSITESQIDVARQRRYFWDAIGKKLDKLGKLITPKDRKKIEAAVALKVPRRRARRKKSHAGR
jgi:hypothetical protein